eukprot:1161070-Pelagomonas_calceolata.AAC.2
MHAWYEGVRARNACIWCGCLHGMGGCVPRMHAYGTDACMIWVGACQECMLQSSRASVCSLVPVCSTSFQISANHLLPTYVAMVACKCCGASTPEGPIFGPPQGYIDTQEVRDVVINCDHGTVFVLDRTMAILGRTWPLYEEIMFLPAMTLKFACTCRAWGAVAVELTEHSEQGSVFCCLMRRAEHLA